MGKGGDEVRLPPHLHPRWLGSEGPGVFLVLLGRGGSRTGSGATQGDGGSADRRVGVTSSGGWWAVSASYTSVVLLS